MKKQRLWVGDIVRTPDGQLAYVNGDSFPALDRNSHGTSIAIDSITSESLKGKCAWWDSDELTLVKQGPLAAYREKGVA